MDLFFLSFNVFNIAPRNIRKQSITLVLKFNFGGHELIL